MGSKRLGAGQVSGEANAWAHGGKCLCGRVLESPSRKISVLTLEQTHRCQGSRRQQRSGELGRGAHVAGACSGPRHPSDRLGESRTPGSPAGGLETVALAVRGWGEASLSCDLPLLAPHRGLRILQQET